jgi:ATP-dependent DNA helicase RecQ
VQLVRRAKGEKARTTQAATASWEGVDRGLFESLRTWRAERAREAQKPAYIIFSDATLRELARIRPTTPEALRLVYGIGETKLRDLGAAVLGLITAHCRDHDLSTNVAIERPPPAPPRPRAMNESISLAFTLFRLGTSIEDVMHQTNRSRATVYDYLCEFIRVEKPNQVHFWIQPTAYDAVAHAAREVGSDRLKPIFLKLGEKYDYDTIRVVVTHLLREQPA